MIVEKRERKDEKRKTGYTGPHVSESKVRGWKDRKVTVGSNQNAHPWRHTHTQTLSFSFLSCLSFFLSIPAGESTNVSSKSAAHISSPHAGDLTKRARGHTHRNTHSHIQKHTLTNTEPPADLGAAVIRLCCVVERESPVLSERGGGSVVDGKHSQG